MKRNIIPTECCEIGTYEHTVPMAIMGRRHDVDYCVADIVAALNAANITTGGSCCGHGHMDGSILLEDGRELKVIWNNYIKENQEEARNAKSETQRALRLTGETEKGSRTVNANYKAMLEKVKPGWWVYTQGICKMENKWLLVAGLLEQYPSLVSVADGRDIVSRCRSDILALHRPTDEPQMATAYKIGEPEEVTREEAEKMVKSNWYWLLPDGQAIRHAVDVLPLENISGMVEAAYAIESPGGNVYRIKEG